MKCPLLSITCAASNLPLTKLTDDCLREECDWWDEDTFACAIWSIMRGLDALGKVLREIEQKMPHAGQ